MSDDVVVANDTGTDEKQATMMQNTWINNLNLKLPVPTAVQHKPTSCGDMLSSTESLKREKKPQKSMTEVHKNSRFHQIQDEWIDQQ